MVAQAFKAADAAYARKCLDAAARCWKRGEARRRNARAGLVDTWRPIELHRATGEDDYAAAAAETGGRCWRCRTPSSPARRSVVRGFWRTSESDADALLRRGALRPCRALALLELAAAFPKHRDAARWRDAVKLHLEEYVLPMAARSAYGIVPFGVFYGSPTEELYRPLAGELTYRYFMPVRKQFWWAGHDLAPGMLRGAARRARGSNGYATSPSGNSNG